MKLVSAHWIFKRIFKCRTNFNWMNWKNWGTQELVESGRCEIDEVNKTLTFFKKELASIGGVNELAVSQYEEVKNNYKHPCHAHLRTWQGKGFPSSNSWMSWTSRKLDAFMKAFNQVSQTFNEIFSTVTSGTGRLFLENPETPFDAGADIRLQFPGKTENDYWKRQRRRKNRLVTVCFILALQSIRPMPFYMMDEIDAHLDVVNSQRLADLLKTQVTRSQFIIVSLKDVTITRATAVFGVFIQEWAYPK